MTPEKVLVWLLAPGESRLAPLVGTAPFPFGFETTHLDTPEEMVARFQDDTPDVLCVEDVFPFQKIRRFLKLTDEMPGRPVTVALAHTINVPTAVTLMEQGVFTVVSGEATADQLSSAVSRAVENRRAFRKILNMRRSLQMSRSSLEKKTYELHSEKVKLRRKMSEVTLMRKVAEWLGRARTEEEGLREVLKTLTSFIGATSGVFLVSAEKEPWIEVDNGVCEIHRLLLPRDPAAFRRAAGIRLAADTMRISAPGKGESFPCNAVAFPVRVKRQFLGYGLFWGDDLQPPAPDTLRLLDAVGVQIGAFCENITLTDQVATDRDRLALANEELNFLFRLASSLHEDPDLDAVFEWLCREIGRFAPHAGIEMVVLTGRPTIRCCGRSPMRGEGGEEDRLLYPREWTGHLLSEYDISVQAKNLVIKEFPDGHGRAPLGVSESGGGCGQRWEFPLVFGKSRLGVLVVHRKDLPTGDRAGDRVLRAVAAQLSIFLHNSLERERVLDMATHDGLTGLYNYRTFQAIFEKEFERHLRYDRNLSLMMIDLDNFKPINDTFGHQVGDEVLRAVAGIIRRNLRKTDYGFRYGGDEFVVLLPDREAAHAAVFAQRIRDAVKSEIRGVGEYRFALSMSAGIADCRAIASRNGEELLRRADGALYLAKNAGRDQVRLAERVTAPERDGSPDPVHEAAER